MCGFAGLLDPSLGPDALGERIRSMTSMLAPRGPDAEGFFVGDSIALGHRRLSILELSSAGAQPMTLGDSHPTIAFNGEVYNFFELKRELETLGWSFHGGSDTEVMLKAYAEWGMNGLRRFEGIFAFALWDPARKRLVLMRDRLGVKPLFYSRIGHGLVFGSEIKSVLASGKIDPALDPQALAEYFWYGNSYEDRTMYRAVRALLPGHWMIVEGGGTRIEAWWKVEDWLEAPAYNGGEREATEAVAEAVDEAVKRQLVADVPVGIFLSGGIDSSAIAASAVRSQPGSLSSFSVGFDFDRGVNELPKARRVAEHLGLEHHEVRIRGAGLEDVLIELARAHDEPFADAANIPLYLLAHQLKGTIKVVLQGDGGDEVFAGYRRHAILRQAAYWRFWPGMFTTVLDSCLGKTGKRISRMGEAAGESDPAMRMALLLTTETRRDPPTTLLEEDARSELAAAGDPFLAYRNCASRFRGADPVQMMLLTDIVLQLPSQFLAKVDRATMACGMEARVPLLDENVARLGIALPSAWKVGRGGKKIILRNAMRGRIPDDILDGPKTGFGVPYEHWLRTSLLGFARDYIMESGFLSRFGFDRSRMEMAFEDHRIGKRNRGFTLWKILQLALWSRASR